LFDKGIADLLPVDRRILEVHRHVVEPDGPRVLVGGR
jgi:hypothetical protein